MAHTTSVERVQDRGQRHGTRFHGLPGRRDHHILGAAPAQVPCPGAVTPDDRSAIAAVSVARPSSSHAAGPRHRRPTIRATWATRHRSALVSAALLLAAAVSGSLADFRPAGMVAAAWGLLLLLTGCMRFVRGGRNREGHHDAADVPGAPAAAAPVRHVDDRPASASAADRTTSRRESAASTSIRDQRSIPRQRNHAVPPRHALRSPTPDGAAGRTAHRREAVGLQ